MSQYFSKPYKPFAGDINVKVDLSNYATKSDLVTLKAQVDKLDIDKLKSVPTDLSNIKSKVDKLDIGKLETTAVGLRKLSNVVKNDADKKTEYNATIKNFEDKIPDIRNVATITTPNTKKNEVKVEIPSISNLVTSTALTAVENRIPDVINLVKEK